MSYKTRRMHAAILFRLRAAQSCLFPPSSPKPIPREDGSVRNKAFRRCTYPFNMQDLSLSKPKRSDNFATSPGGTSAIGEEPRCKQRGMILVYSHIYMLPLHRSFHDTCGNSPHIVISFHNMISFQAQPPCSWLYNSMVFQHLFTCIQTFLRRDQCISIT